MFFWYWLTRAILDERPLNGLLSYRTLHYIQYA